MISLGKSGNILDNLLELGFMDDSTYKIIKEKMGPKPIKQRVEIRAINKDRLKKIAEVKDRYMPYSRWREYLGMTKEGAF